MSLILDALNRSRQDSEQTPGLASVHPVDAPAAGGRWILWLLVSALALAVLAVGWLLLDRLPQPAPALDAAVAVTAAPPAEQPRVVPPAPEPAGEPQIAPAPPPPVNVQRPETTQAVPAAAAAPPPDPEPIVTAAQPVQERAPVDADIAALYRQQEQAPAETPVAAKPVEQVTSELPATGTVASGREEVAVDIEALVERAQAELADARLSEHEVPFLTKLSQQTKDDIPTIMYQQHDYSGDRSRSSVVLNGKNLQAGGSIGGVKVQEILPDSVVLEYQGTRFRLRALNSWVNL